MRIEYLYRYPVKGLTAEALEAAEVEEGGCIPWDRAFALAQGDAAFDPDRPQWLQKANFMCQMKNARIAALFSFFEPRTGMLAIRAPDGIDATELVRSLRDRFGITIANGQAALKGKIFRIGHIGYFDVFDITTALAAIELVLADLGAEIERGVAVTRALEAYEERARV